MWRFFNGGRNENDEKKDEKDNEDREIDNKRRNRDRRNDLENGGRGGDVQSADDSSVSEEDEPRQLRKRLNEREQKRIDNIVKQKLNSNRQMKEAEQRVQQLLALQHEEVKLHNNGSLFFSLLRYESIGR